MSAVAAKAWRFRTLVEREATTRFAAFAARLRERGLNDLATVATRAAEDERRHAALCIELADALGAAPLRDDEGWTARRLAPSAFGEDQALIYEIVAQCCIAETESMATLSTLMERMAPSRFRDAVHSIARDEVVHARLGWALLDAERPRQSFDFLHGHLVSMIRTGGEPLFDDPLAGEDDPELVAFGVLPHHIKREVFVATLTEVIIPGLTRAGINATEITAWLRR